MKVWIGVLCAILAMAPGYGRADEVSLAGEVDQKWIQGLTGSDARRLIFDAYGDAAQAIGSATYQDDVCGCKIHGSEGRIVDPVSCQPVFAAQDEKKAFAVAVSLMTPSRWASRLQCYRLGAQTCRGDRGIMYAGETCCSRVDQSYLKIKNDLNFYVVMPVPVAEYLSEYSVGFVQNPRKPFPGCKVIVDDAQKTWSLSSEFNGFLARLDLYAARHYGAVAGVTLSELKRRSGLAPPAEWEFGRSLNFSQRQGGRSQDVTDGYRPR